MLGEATSTKTDKPYIEDDKVVLKHHGEIDQPWDKEMHPGASCEAGLLTVLFLTFEPENFVD